MTARCASCSYPLSVSDSVSCFECLCYFHIDCAQLVGFPYYELSADPVRNTFRCTTCRVLPIPGRSQDPQCAPDSDSDSEDAMPSRQLDYHHLEPPGDMARDMHELKGNVQDLSELCKDMMREINDLKSINLALRCGVENLRHENEDRDKAIDELRKRLDALEGGRIGFKPNHQRLNEHLDIENNVILNSQIEENEGKTLDFERSNIPVRSKRHVEFSNVPTDFLDCESNTEKISKVPENSIAKNILNPDQVKENRNDWDWRGRRAIELNGSREESEVDEGETEESDIEETEKAWETLHNEVESQRKEVVSEGPPADKTVEETQQLNSEDELEEKCISEQEGADIQEDESGLKSSERKNIINEENLNDKETEDILDAEVQPKRVNFDEPSEGSKLGSEDLKESKTIKSIQDDSFVNVKESKRTSDDENEEDSTDYESEEEAVSKETINIEVEKSHTDEVSSTSKHTENDEEQKDQVTSAVEEELDASEDISDNEREEEADDRSTNTLREELEDLDALDEVDEGCEEDSDRLEREESETLANEERNFDKPVAEEEVRASVAQSDEKELMTRSSSLRSLLLDDVVEVDVGKIDEEAEESHDEHVLENVAEENAETDHELTEHNEEDILENGDIEHQVDEHLENNIDQDREEHLEGDVEDAGSRLEGRVEEADSRLEDADSRPCVAEEDVVTEGEQRMGGQSPDLAGEVQPTQEPESHSPQHSEEDLWHYLKESVSMEHPHTVEEFLHSLIGTLQHVPEDLLQPVIEENIKRANSPCSETDVERVNSSCSLRQEGESSASLPRDGAGAAPEGAESPAVEGETVTHQSTEPQEDDPARDAEGYSIVEASA